MWLHELHADKLRNLKSVALELAAGVTIVTGRNGQGKTSVLEAIYLAGTARSFRTTRVDELIARDGGPLRVSAGIRALAGPTTLGVVVDSGERHLYVNGTERPIEEFLGRLDLVALPTDSARILRDGPEGRRRFVDSGIVGVRPGFLSDLGEYRRVLAERNALLRRSQSGARPSLGASLDAWDERLALSAARIHRQRREYVVELASRLGPAERMLLPEDEGIVLRYKPSPQESGADDASRFEATYRRTLETGRRRDLALGFTSEGPHRDDVETTFAGNEIRRFGSAGQLRATMIALCAGKLSLLKERHRESPVFLMDDFDSDLDESKVRSLLDFLREGGFQALLATSKAGFLDTLGFSLPMIRMEGGLARAA